jgi:hypothetical protein
MRVFIAKELAMYLKSDIRALACFGIIKVSRRDAAVKMA